MSIRYLLTDPPGVWATNPDRACAQPGVDPDVFFPERGSNASVVDAARAVCQPCVVRGDCGEYAITNFAVHGIWGGLTNEQRRLERQRRRAEAT